MGYRASEVWGKAERGWIRVGEGGHVGSSGQMSLGAGRMVAVVSGLGAWGSGIVVLMHAIYSTISLPGLDPLT